MNMPVIMTTLITDDRLKINTINNFIVIDLIQLDFIRIIRYYHIVRWNGQKSNFGRGDFYLFLPFLKKL